MNHHQTFCNSKRIIHILLIISLAFLLYANTVVAKFDPVLFIDSNTTFFSDFKKLREHWFSVEDSISSIKDEYEEVDWKNIKDKAKEVVMMHERMMVKFARDCRAARSKLQSKEAEQAQHTVEIVQEYIDSVGLVVLKLYEISEKLYNKTVDPYSYTMVDYNNDMKHFKQLNETFQNRGKVLNNLFYGK